MTLEELYKICDDLCLNITMKRHPRATFYGEIKESSCDVRVYHPWIHNPLLSECKHPTFKEAMKAICGRAESLENMREHITKVNAKRASKRAKIDKRGHDIECDLWWSSWNNWV